MRLKQERCVVVVVVLFYLVVSSSSLFEQSIKAQNSRLVSLTTALIRPQSSGSSAVREQPTKKSKEKKERKRFEKKNFSLLKKEGKKHHTINLPLKSIKPEYSCIAPDVRQALVAVSHFLTGVWPLEPAPPSPAPCVSSLFSCVFSACVLFCC